MTDGAETLLRLVAHLRDGTDLPADDRRHIALAVETWLTGNATTLDAAFHVQPQPGQRSLPTQFARQRRDDLIRQAAARFAQGDTPAAQARWLAERWRRYAGTAWSRERHLDAPPAHRAGTVEALFWQAMKVADVVLRERTVRQILAASTPYSLPSPGRIVETTDTIERGPT